MDTRHHNAARCLAQGGTLREAAELAGVSAQSISNWKRNPEFAALIEEYVTATEAPTAPATPSEIDALPDTWREDAAHSLALCVGPALDTLLMCMRGGPVTKAQADVARWVVDRVGIQAPSAEDGGAAMSEEELLELLRKMPPDMLREALEQGHVH